MWYLQDQWRPRMAAEYALMRERFQGFRLRELDDGRLQWMGELRPEGREPFLISLIYPPRYPYAEPKLFVEAPPLRSGAPHVYSDGSLCIHKRDWSADRGTAASEVPLAAAWLVGYLYWLKTGEPW